MCFILTKGSEMSVLKYFQYLIWIYEYAVSSEHYGQKNLHNVSHSCISRHNLIDLNWSISPWNNERTVLYQWTTFSNTQVITPTNVCNFVRIMLKDYNVLPLGIMYISNCTHKHVKSNDDHYTGLTVHGCVIKSGRYYYYTVCNFHWNGYYFWTANQTLY